MALPPKYAYLAKETAPKILMQAIKLVGIKEAPGKASNPIILEWAKELGDTSSYTADSIPWCGLAMAICAKRAGQKVPKIYLRALSWASFGTPVPKDKASLGDILTFTRNGGGHVGLYVGEDQYCYHVLGGNQSNQFGFTRIARSRLYSVSRSKWFFGQPPSVRKILLTANGTVSENEV